MTQTNPPQFPHSPDQSPPPGPSGPQPPQPPPQAPPPGYWTRRRPGGKGKTVAIVVLLILLGLSGLLNLVLLGALVVGPETCWRSETIRPGREAQTVALYELRGIVNDEMATHFANFGDQVLADENVKAVVLRVESPGGGVAPADRIHHCVGQLRDSGKTVVVTMGGVAASGGYYVSAGADEIVAEPTTITGSIGVLAGWLVVEGTLEKLGAEMVVLKSTASRGWKDEISSFSQPDQRHLDHIRKLLDDIQARFEQVVRDGRKDRLNPQTLPPYTMIVKEAGEEKQIVVRETEPFNGKVFTAERALELGLIDEIGYERSAIDRAAKLARLSRPKVVRYRPRRSMLQRLLGAHVRRSESVLSPRTLDELQVPRIRMIWKVD